MELPNLNYIRKLSGGDSNFEQKLIDVIKMEFPSECAEFKDNIDQNNHLEAAQNVHKLKHKISILGLEQSYLLADEFENDLKNDDPSRLVEFDEVLNQISAFLETI
ncbi:MAG: Hpt domain-containing protein [Flavobacteriaceae bacterium]|nr:Hpt domain-containing protein [Flavobacteriaceae bacterium]